MAPIGTLGRAQARVAPGERMTFYVHTHVREDALLLYAFATSEDKAAFRTLISVSNVGPKIALALLSALPADDLARAVTGKESRAAGRGTRRWQEDGRAHHSRAQRQDVPAGRSNRRTPGRRRRWSIGSLECRAAHERPDASRLSGQRS